MAKKKTIYTSRVRLIVRLDRRTAEFIDVELNWYDPSRSNSESSAVDVGSWWVTSGSLGRYRKVAEKPGGVVYISWFDTNGRKKGGLEKVLSFFNEGQEPGGSNPAF